MNKQFVYQVGNNKKVILWCTANQISSFKLLDWYAITKAACVIITLSCWEYVNWNQKLFLVFFKIVTDICFSKCYESWFNVSWKISESFVVTKQSFFVHQQHTPQKKKLSRKKKPYCIWSNYANNYANNGIIT